MHRCRVYGVQPEAPGKKSVELWDSLDSPHGKGRLNPPTPIGEPVGIFMSPYFKILRARVNQFKLSRGLSPSVDWEIRGIV
jgi:hypothetical protein